MRQFYSDLGVGRGKASKTSTHKAKAAGVVIGREAEILCDIEAPGIAAAIWQRKPVALFQNWIDQLGDDQLPELRAVVPVNLVAEAVQKACKIAKLPKGREQNMLAGDIGALALMYSKIMRIDHVQIRLDVSDGVMCPKFHTDSVPARLLCTYRGPATEYVTEDQLDDPDAIRSMQTSAVGLFRGANWPSVERSSLLHRSPMVSEGAPSRLLLVIDAVE